jgi:hypothetical protein
MAIQEECQKTGRCAGANRKHEGITHPKVVIEQKCVFKEKNLFKHTLARKSTGPMA